jgi:hypothetical protein
MNAAELVASARYVASLTGDVLARIARGLPFVIGVLERLAVEREAVRSEPGGYVR